MELMSDIPMMPLVTPRMFCRICNPAELNIRICNPLKSMFTTVYSRFNRIANP